MSQQEPPQDQRDAIAEWAHGLRAAGKAWHDIESALVDTGRTAAERDTLERHGRRVEAWHRDWFHRTRAAEKARESRETGIEGEWLEDGGAGESGGAPLLRREAPEDLGAVLVYLFKDLVREDIAWVFSGYHTLQPGERWEQVKGPGSLGRVEWRAAAVIVRGGARGTRIYTECRVRGIRKPGWNGTRLESLHMEHLTLGNDAVRRVERQLKEARKTLKANPREGCRRTAAVRRVARLEALLEKKRELCAPAFDAEKVMSRLATIAVHYRFKDTGLANNNDAAEATDRTKQAVSAQRHTLTKEYVDNTGGRAGFEGQRSRK